MSIHIKNTTLKLGAFLIICYFSFAIILFPWFYYNGLMKGGVNYIFYQFYHDYLATFIISIGVLGVVFYLLHLKADSQGSFINRFLHSNAYFIAILLFFAFAGFRLIIFNLSNKSFDYEELAKYIQENEKPKDKKLEAPVDIIYVNKEKVEYLYDQIKEDLELKEKSITKKDNSEVGVEAGYKNVVNVKGTKGKENEETTSYHASEKSITNKLVLVINNLFQQGRINEISNIELQSNKLKQFDASIKVLDSNGIKLPKDIITKTLAF